MLFISDKIQLNEAAHGCDYRAMVLVWAASERHKRLFMKIRRGKGVKKGFRVKKWPSDNGIKPTKIPEISVKRQRNETVMV
jgi:hypothetical protein